MTARHRQNFWSIAVIVLAAIPLLVLLYLASFYVVFDRSRVAFAARRPVGGMYDGPGLVLAGPVPRSFFLRGKTIENRGLVILAGDENAWLFRLYAWQCRRFAEQHRDAFFIK